MEPPTKRLFSPTRIAALALIALALAGLAFLRFSSGSGEVSVPQGAHAGQLVLHPCTYATEQGGYAADCGTLVVPENRHDSRSRLIALPVKRIRALSAGVNVNSPTIAFMICSASASGSGGMPASSSRFLTKSRCACGKRCSGSNFLSPKSS